MDTDSDSRQKTVGSIRVAFFLNLAFTILEFFGGVWTNSVAILSDALHDLGDCLSLGLSWLLERFSQKRGDAKYTFGYRRFSLLGALITAIVLLGGSFLVLSEAIPRLINPEPAHAPGMIIFAIVGILVNGAAVLKLRGQSGLNASVVAWHLLEDVLGWTAVLIVALALLLTDFYILDPILSIMVTLFVLYNVAKNLRKTLKVLLQAAPEGVEIDLFEHKVREIDGVQDIHHTHIWSMDGEQHILTTHVVLPDGFDPSNVSIIKRKVRTVAEELGIRHTTLEIESSGEYCENGECR
jgi:cobalt-zinc-cadmium efflux system protein